MAPSPELGRAGPGAGLRRGMKSCLEPVHVSESLWAPQERRAELGVVRTAGLELRRETLTGEEEMGVPGGGGGV